MKLIQGQAKFIKLILVSQQNNNKFYELSWDGESSTFTVKYGRVESTVTTATYGIGSWDSKYREKIKKGYIDVTDMVAVEVEEKKGKPSKRALVGIPQIDDFLERMQRYTDNLVSSTYSVKADSVTQAQIDKAQELINTLNKKKLSKEDINSTLISLYTIIPRKMSKVNQHLLPAIKLEDILEDEQDNLDAMASQVKMNTIPKKEETTKTTKAQDKNLLEALKVKMTLAKNTKELDYLLKQFSKSHRYTIFEANKEEEDKYFEEWKKTRKDQSTKILIHGTKCASVLPILEIGLKIRPKGNFQFSGKAYGNGNYFSEVVQKSLGYTGGGKDQILFVYEVHTGNPFVYDGWYRGNSFPLTLEELTKRGYDSTYVKAGNGLLNSEIIAYSEKQNRLKYIIWLHN